mmetsp:Transcript_22668/g.56289  ORF Transcript_22668/g.56289 Transcript_22668/m.56289 type:complete len:245 (+) Transcript_22668:482-1216(+)
MALPRLGELRAALRQLHPLRLLRAAGGQRARPLRLLQAAGALLRAVPPHAPRGAALRRLRRVALPRLAGVCRAVRRLLRLALLHRPRRRGLRLLQAAVQRRGAVPAVRRGLRGLRRLAVPRLGPLLLLGARLHQVALLQPARLHLLPRRQGRRPLHAQRHVRGAAARRRLRLPRRRREHALPAAPSAHEPFLLPAGAALRGAARLRHAARRRLCAHRAGGAARVPRAVAADAAAGQAHHLHDDE